MRSAPSPSPILSSCITFLCLSLSLLSACGSPEGTPGYGAAPIDGPWSIPEASYETIPACANGNITAMQYSFTMIEPTEAIYLRRFYVDLGVVIDSYYSEVYHLVCKIQDTPQHSTYIPPLPFDCTGTSEDFYKVSSDIQARYRLTFALADSFDQMAFGADLPEFSGNYSRFQDGAYTLTTTEDCEGSDCGTEAAVGSGVCVASGLISAIWSGCEDPDAMCADSAEQLE